MHSQRVPDDEIVFRRIPSSAPWFEPPDRITSANFKLAPKEEGKSVYRASLLTGEELLTRSDAIPGSFLAQATVGEIRRLENAKGEPLGLDVVAIADETDPGHAEIRGPTAGKLSPAASRALQRLFTLVPKGSLENSSSTQRTPSKIGRLSGWRILIRWFVGLFKRPH